MSDIRVEAKGNKLVITMPIEKATLSASGKTMLVASTHGNVGTEAKVTGHALILGINAYYKL